MKKIILLAVISSITSIALNAQSMGRTYKTALGVKVWDGAPVSLSKLLLPPKML
jgi:hypothetical protein